MLAQYVMNVMSKKRVQKNILTMTMKILFGYVMNVLKRWRPIMPKLTGKRLKKIIEDANTLHLGYKETHVADAIVNHPEIKSLFECEEVKPLHQSEQREQFDLLKECLTSKTWTAGDHGHFYGFFLHGWLGRMNEATYQHLPPTELLTDASKTIEPPAPVAEYDIVEYEVRNNSSVTECKHYGYGIGGCCCRDGCKTNGLQNFVGHEVEGKSIRCLHKFNLGGEG
jgi:hypothetical protein